MSADSSGPPTFSFLTTAYRSEGTVGRTIGAVLAQTLPDWELVVVDNGNSEAMYEAVSPYLTDPRISLVRQENRGVTGGLLAAAEHAVGRYLVVLNSDDSIRPDFAQRMADFLETSPDVAAVTCDAVLFVDPGQRPFHPSYLRRAGLKKAPDPTRALRVSDVIDGPCPYYTAPVRRDVWDAVGGMGDQGGKASLVSDLDFWLRILTAGYDVRTLPDALGLFRIESGSVSLPVGEAASQKHEEQLERSLRGAAERSGLPEDWQALDRVTRRLRYGRAVRRARLALQSGSAAEARGQYRIALRQRRTVRAVLVYLALRVAPAATLALYRAKQNLEVPSIVGTARRQVSRWRRPPGGDA